MNQAELQIIAEIKKLALDDPAEALFYGSVEEHVVCQAESSLNVKFPFSYRAYLRHIGAAKMLGHDFDGLPNNSDYIDEPPLYLNVVDHTMLFREELTSFTDSMIYITDDGGSVFYYLDTSLSLSKVSNDELPVCAYRYGMKIFIADSFIDFIRLLVNKPALYAILNG